MNGFKFDLSKQVCGGCNSKADSLMLEKLLSHIPRYASNDFSSISDDASVYEINENSFLLNSIDYNLVADEDPFVSGQIGAVNAISDIYAMGVKPLQALMIVGYPFNLGDSLLAETMVKGVVDMCESQDIPILGGHTINSDNIIVGLSVSAIASKSNIKYKKGAQIGDKIVITKKLGSGVMITANKHSRLTSNGKQNLYDVILKVNDVGAYLGSLDYVHSITDITGFGLAGHCTEMVELGEQSFVIDVSKIPVIDDLKKYICDGFISSMAWRNLTNYGHKIGYAPSLTLEDKIMLNDPQTNGGLIFTVPPERENSVLEGLREHGCFDSQVVGFVDACNSDNTLLFI